MSKLDTINYRGKDYATVPVRLKEFREKNPKASISTDPKFLDDGSVVFQATIISDMSDDTSARATGTARYSKLEVSKTKAFEKLETISVGRALSLLGYLNDGQVASTEEMREFEGFQQEKFDKAVDEVSKATKGSEFKAILAGLTSAQQKEITPIVNARIKELKNAGN